MKITFPEFAKLKTGWSRVGVTVRAGTSYAVQSAGIELQNYCKVKPALGLGDKYQFFTCLLLLLNSSHGHEINLYHWESIISHIGKIKS